jgi:hypothetical protein
MYAVHRGRRHSQHLCHDSTYHACMGNQQYPLPGICLQDITQTCVHSGDKVIQQLRTRGPMSNRVLQEAHHLPGLLRLQLLPCPAFPATETDFRKTRIDRYRQAVSLSQRQRKGMATLQG